MRKKYILFLVIIIILNNSKIYYAGQIEIPDKEYAFDIKINKKRIRFSKEVGEPFILDDIIMVPLRIMARNMGFSVQWNESDNMIHLSDGVNRVKLEIGKFHAIKNDSIIPLNRSDGEITDMKSLTLNDITYVPVDFFRIGLNGRITHDNQELIHYINITTTNPNLSVLNPDIGKDINIRVNGKKVIFNNETGYPYSENQRIMVPIRAMAKYLNLGVTWDGISQFVTVYNEDMILELEINNHYATRNDSRIPIEINKYGKIIKTKPRLKSSRAYIPLRFLIEAMGGKLVYERDDYMNYISITTDGQEPVIITIDGKIKKK